MHVHGNLKIITLLLISAVLFFLHFTARPCDISIRSLDYAWDMGHLVSFFIWTLTGLNFFKPGSRPSFFKLILRVVLITAGAAASIELIQLFFNRSADVDDILKGLLGSLTALAFFSSSRFSWPRQVLRMFQIVIILLIMLASYPLISAFIDESIAQVQFPVLSDFETAFETQRWHGNIRYTVVDEVAVHGRHSLKMDLNTAKYSGITLHHFPESWEKYRYIEFSIYNPAQRSLKITCSIHDRLHLTNGMKYRDRFNRRFKLRSGWNTFQIAMDDIHRAPQTRKMDLSRIQRFSLFATQLPYPETIYIDYIRLIP